MKNISSLIKSLSFHAIVIVVVSVSFLFKDHDVKMTETPIEISFVSEPSTDSPQPKKPVIVKEEPPKTPPVTKNKPQPAVKSLETPKPKTKAKLAETTQQKKTEPVKAPPKKATPVPAPAKNNSKPKPPEKPQKQKLKTPEKPAEEATQAEFTSVLKNLADTKPVDTKRKGPQLTQTPTVDRVTTGELNAFRQQLSGCWNLLPGAANAEALAVNLTITVNPDRTVRNVQITDRSRYTSDPFFRAAADNAIRAIKHPDCTPLDLPPNKYDQWDEITLNFDPNSMF